MRVVGLALFAVFGLGVFASAQPYLDYFEERPDILNQPGTVRIGCHQEVTDGTVRLYSLLLAGLPLRHNAKTRIPGALCASLRSCCGIPAARAMIDVTFAYYDEFKMPKIPELWGLTVYVRLIGFGA